MTSHLKGLLKSTAHAALAAAGPHRLPNRTPKLWVLMYHRVLPTDDARARVEEPGMRVTPATLARHLEWLRPVMPVVSLGSWLEAARRGATLPNKACALTFDDGWKDNFEFAWPVLRSAGAPATVFVVADRVDRPQLFWPNRLMRLLRDHAARIEDLPELRWLRKRAPSPLPRDPTPDQASALVEWCKTLDDAAIEQRLDAAEAVLGVPPCRDNELMSWTELKELQASGLIEIASHGSTHRRLREGLPPEVLKSEVLGSAKTIQDHIGSKPSLFCYPNGDLCPEAEKMVRDHYAGAVTTARGVNRAETTDFHRLRRIAVHEDSASTRSAFLSRLAAVI